MSLPKMFAFVTACLFGIIGIAALMKRGHTPVEQAADHVNRGQPIEIPLLKEGIADIVPSDREHREGNGENDARQKGEGERARSQLPDADRIEELFNKREPKLPIVQTITYKSRAPWLKGRPAWIADYASHYKTSRHFIARSLNEKPDYDKQDIFEGECFNVFREDKNFEFYLIIDIELSKMWLYYYDHDTNERVLLKTYAVGLGRRDEHSPSGSLTPLGKYTFGDKVAVYKPKTMAHYRGKKVDMVTVFGTRWIPFDQEVGRCTASPKGFGIHGLPLRPDEQGEFAEDLSLLEKNESDGCIRLATKDIEEIYAIVITRPTTIELVENFHQAALPGEETVLQTTGNAK
ncbi:MAG: L,D-transpeptidase [Waddliaceae bacterium]